jgi:hypothetical protein
VNGRRKPTWQIVAWSLGWVVLLALLPWWLGLPLLLAFATASLLLPHRLAAGHAWLIRRALRWGLPGVLFAGQRALGGDAFAWGAALLGALAGYTLLAGLEAWLDRGLRRASVATSPAEWPDLAMAPIGPAAEIIELQLPLWHPVVDGRIDPGQEFPRYRDGALHFADGTRVNGMDPQFSLSEQWTVARMARDRGVVLWQRGRNRPHRLRGWQLAGWHRGQPWFFRNEREMPLALDALLNRDDING